MKRKIAETAAEIEVLHLSLGQYARMLWDAQAGRVAVGNRIKAVEKIGLPDSSVVDALKDVELSFIDAERKCNANILRCVKSHPLARWIEAQRGIGLASFANLLGVTGPLDRFPTVSKLWKYLGLDVRPDGHAPRAKKGEGWTHTDCTFQHLRTCKPDCVTDHHPNCVVGGVGTAFSPMGKKVCCFNIAEMGIEHQSAGSGGPYRAAYDGKKAYYEAERPDWTPMHRRVAARRYAAKMFIKALWIEWHTHFKTGRVAEWEERETERAATVALMPEAVMPPAPEPEARYDYALPVGAR